MVEYGIKSTHNPIFQVVTKKLSQSQELVMLTQYKNKSNERRFSIKLKGRIVAILQDIILLQCFISLIEQIQQQVQ